MRESKCGDRRLTNEFYNINLERLVRFPAQTSLTVCCPWTSSDDVNCWNVDDVREIVQMPVKIVKIAQYLATMWTYFLGHRVFQSRSVILVMWNWRCPFMLQVLTLLLISRFFDNDTANLTLHPIQSRSFRKWSSQPMTNKTVQENTQTKYNSKSKQHIIQQNKTTLLRHSHSPSPHGVATKKEFWLRHFAYLTLYRIVMPPGTTLLNFKNGYFFSEISLSNIHILKLEDMIVQFI